MIAMSILVGEKRLASDETVLKVQLICFNISNKFYFWVSKEIWEKEKGLLLIPYFFGQNLFSFLINRNQHLPIS